MSVFAQRSGGYKAGLLLLLLGCVVFIAGFSSPNWTETSLSYSGNGYHHEPDYADSAAMWAGMSVVVDIHGHSGLWVTCNKASGHSQCASLNNNTPGWFSVVRVLQCIALIGLVVSSGYAIVLNWMQHNPTHNRLVEIVAALSALTGFTGAIVYVVKSMDNGLESFHQNYDNGLYHGFSHVSWALAVDIGGCVLSFLAAIVIAVNNQSLQSQVSPSPTHTSGSSSSSNYPHGPITVVPRPVNTDVRVFYVAQPGAVPAMMNPPAYEATYPPAVQNEPAVVVATATSQTSTTTGAAATGDSVTEVTTPAAAAVADTVKTQPPSAGI